MITLRRESSGASEGRPAASVCDSRHSRRGRYDHWQAARVHCLKQLLKAHPRHVSPA